MSTTADAQRREEESKLIKISLNLPAYVFEIVKALAARSHTTNTAVIRHAIEYMKFVEDVRQNGGKVLIKEPGQELKEVVFR